MGRMKVRFLFAGLVGLASVLAVTPTTRGQVETRSGAASQLVILDTDIGDDIDDAFALALVLRSPELDLLGVTTEFGDTALRARLVDRYLKAVDRGNIPVRAGVETPAANHFTQAAYAHEAPDLKHGDAVEFLFSQIRKHPNQITLIAIGPLVNVRTAIGRDPETFRKLKRVVLMGGSIYRGYDGPGGASRPPDPEWNVRCDPAGLRALLASGVPVFMMPLDSTQVHLESPKLRAILSHGSPLSDQLALLYLEWTENREWPLPTLFDPVAVTFAFRPDLCPTSPLRLEVDDKGDTKPVSGPPNAEVCLKSNEQGFLDLLLSRILK